MKPIKHGTVLITGGSKGIGLAIAKTFAEHGHNIILVARDEETLHQAAKSIRAMAHVHVSTFALDLAVNHAAQDLFTKVNQAGLEVDILVNNAGVGMTGCFATSDITRMSNMLNLNMLALSQLTHLFLQPMLERNQGRILNIGSIVSYFSGSPNWLAYVASKHFVLAFTKGLSRELKGTGVAATVVSPGATTTDFVATANAQTMRAYQVPSSVSIKTIAHVAYQACQRGKPTAIPGMLNKILAFLGELHPRFIAFEVLAFLSSKQHKR